LQYAGRNAASLTYGLYLYVSTFDADVAGLEVRDEISLTRMQVDQFSHAHVAARSGGAERVEVRFDVLVAADVEGAAYAPPGTHTAETGLGD